MQQLLAPTKKHRRILSSFGDRAIPMYIQRFETTDSQGIAELLVWVLQAQGAAAKDAIRSIERVQQNPSGRMRSEERRLRR